MFDSKLKPVSLYVEQGRELVHANTKSAKGNFHMKPNGIFYISAGNAAVAETQAFLKQRPQADLATQSGPMLVMDGRLHPVLSGAARRSNCVLVLAYVQMAKSYSPSLKTQSHLTASHAYSAMGRNALMRCFLTGAVLRAYSCRHSIVPEISCRSALCWLYSKQIEPHQGNSGRCALTVGLSA
jgi:hypothetical protein